MYAGPFQAPSLYAARSAHHANGRCATQRNKRTTLGRDPAHHAPKPLNPRSGHMGRCPLPTSCQHEPLSVPWVVRTHKGPPAMLEIEVDGEFVILGEFGNRWVMSPDTARDIARRLHAAADKSDGKGPSPSPTDHVPAYPMMTSSEWRQS